MCPSPDRRATEGAPAQASLPPLAFFHNVGWKGPRSDPLRLPPPAQGRTSHPPRRPRAKMTCREARVHVSCHRHHPVQRAHGISICQPWWAPSVDGLLLERTVVEVIVYALLDLLSSLRNSPGMFCDWCASNCGDHVEIPGCRVGE